MKIMWIFWCLKINFNSKHVWKISKNVSAIPNFTAISFVDCFFFFFAWLTGESSSALDKYKQHDGWGKLCEDPPSIALSGRVACRDHREPHRDRSHSCSHFLPPSLSLIHTQFHTLHIPQKLWSSMGWDWSNADTSFCNKQMVERTALQTSTGSCGQHLRPLSAQVGRGLGHK